jgi:hypothetical protein
LARTIKGARAHGTHHIALQAVPQRLQKRGRPKKVRQVGEGGRRRRPNVSGAWRRLVLVCRRRRRTTNGHAPGHGKDRLESNTRCGGTETSLRAGGRVSGRGGPAGRAIVFRLLARRERPRAGTRFGGARSGRRSLGRGRDGTRARRWLVTCPERDARRGQTTAQAADTDALGPGHGLRGRITCNTPSG